MSARSRLAALAAVTALSLALPAVLPAQGVLGRIKKQAQDAMVGAAGGAGGSGGGLPAGFARPEFEITSARLTAILRAADRAAAAAKANRALEEREQSARESQARSRHAERRQVADKNRPWAECIMKAMSTIAGMKLGQNGPETDPKRAKLLALQTRAQELGRDAQRREQAGQRVDTAAYMAKSNAIQDTTLTLLGMTCPPRPTEIDKDDDDDEPRQGQAASAEMPAGWVDTDDLFRAESGLTERQWGVIRDKLVAYFEARERNVEPAGFSADELSALRAANARLAQHKDPLLGRGQW